MNTISYKDYKKGRLPYIFSPLCLSNIFLTLSCLLLSPSLIAGSASQSLNVPRSLNIQVLENGTVMGPKDIIARIRRTDSRVVCTKIDKVNVHFENNKFQDMIHNHDYTAVTIGNLDQGLCNFDKSFRQPAWRITRVAFGIRHPNYNSDSYTKSKLRPNEGHVRDYLSRRCTGHKNTFSQRVRVYGQGWKPNTVSTDVRNVASSGSESSFPEQFLTVNVECGVKLASYAPNKRQGMHIRLLNNSRSITVYSEDKSLIRASSARIVYRNGKIVPGTSASLPRPAKTKRGRPITLTAGSKSPAGRYYLQVYVNKQWTILSNTAASITIIDPRSGAGTAPRSNRVK